MSDDLDLDDAPDDTDVDLGEYPSNPAMPETGEPGIGEDPDDD